MQTAGNHGRIPAVCIQNALGRPFLGLEAGAAEINSFHAYLVPGLFQTPEYAEAVFRANPDLTDEEIQRRVELRLGRQIAWYDRAMTRLPGTIAGTPAASPQGGDHVNEHPLEPPRGIQFRKSSYSNDYQACVEVAVAPDGGRWLRDTKDRTTPARYYPATEWDAFIRGVKDGEFD